MEPIVFSRVIGLCGIGTFCQKVSASLSKSFTLLTNYCFALSPCLGLDTTIQQVSQRNEQAGGRLGMQAIGEPTIGATRWLLLSRRPASTGPRRPHLTLHRHGGASA